MVIQEDYIDRSLAGSFFNVLQDYIPGIESLTLGRTNRPEFDDQEGVAGLGTTLGDYVRGHDQLRSVVFAREYLFDMPMATPLRKVAHLVGRTEDKLMELSLPGAYKEHIYIMPMN